MGEQQDKADRNVDSLEALAEGRGGDADEEIAPVGPAAAADDGAAVLVALHNTDLAQRYADRAVFLERGQVAFDGPMDDLGTYLSRRGYYAYLETAP